VGDQNRFATLKETGGEIVDITGITRAFIKTEFTEAGMLSEDKVPLRINGVFDYYSAEGQKLFGGFYTAGSFQDGKAAVQTDKAWGIIGEDGKFIMEPKFEDIKLNSCGRFNSNGIMAAKLSGRYGLYDMSFKRIGDFGCDDMDIPTEDGLIAFRQNDLWGFVNAAGEVVIEPSWEDAKSFSNGFAAVCKDGLWGFINKNNELLIDLQFNSADYFTSAQTCVVSRSEKSYKLIKLV
jgi:hypothetical protein